MPKLSTCCRDPAVVVVVHAVPAFDVSGEWSGAEWRSRPRAREREGEITKSDPKRRERRGAHKGLNAEWGKLPSRASKVFMELKKEFNPYGRAEPGLQ